MEQGYYYTQEGQAAAEAGEELFEPYEVLRSQRARTRRRRQRDVGDVSNQGGGDWDSTGYGQQGHEHREAHEGELGKLRG